MSVYEQGYRRWEGERRSPLFCWLAIPKFAFMDIVNKRLFLVFLTASFMPFLVRMAYIYAIVSPGMTEIYPPLRVLMAQLPVDGAFFMTFLVYQIFFCMMFAFQIGAGLMTRDFEHQAFILYFSKPISRLEYFIGKFSVLFTTFMAITAAQALLLYLIQYQISPDASPWRTAFVQGGYASIPLYILLYSLVITVTVSLMILAASCMTKNGRYAGTLYAVTLIALFIGGNAVAATTGNLNFRAISPVSSLISVGYRIFHLSDYGRALPVTAQNPISAAAAWTCVIVCCVLCALVIKVRLDIAARRGR